MCGNLKASRGMVWKGWARVFLGESWGSKYALKYRTSFRFFLFGFIILSFLIRLHYWFTIFIFLNGHFFLFFGWHIRFRFGTIVLYTAYTVLITFTFVLIFVLVKSILLFKKFLLLVFTINVLIASQKSWYYWISPWIKPIKVILTSYVCMYIVLLILST